MSMVDVPLGELLDPFTPDPEAFMEDYGAYFRPYDPSQEIRLKRAYELKQAGAMSDLGQDLYDAQNIIGKTGFKSSYQDPMIRESSIDSTLAEIRGMTASKKAGIYNIREKWAEDFYDTISDLASLGAFDDIPWMAPPELMVDLDPSGLEFIPPDPGTLVDPLVTIGEEFVDLDLVGLEDETGIVGGGSGSLPDFTIDPGGGTGGGGVMPGGGGSGWSSGIIDWGSSDYRVKENVEFTGQESGFNIYEFNYKWDKNNRYKGVMAQDLLGTEYEKAVGYDANGHMMVDYGQLPIKMKKA